MPIQYKPWEIITEFALKWPNSEDFVSKAEKDFHGLWIRYNEACKTALEAKGDSPKNLENSLSMQNFYGWLNNLYCFYMLVFSGFRHTALRELRFLLESSGREYYLDRKYDGKTYEEKVTLLTVFKPRTTKEDLKLLRALLCEKQYDKVKRRSLGFGELLIDVPNKEELKSFYYELCNYVHLSEIAQRDRLRYFASNIALKHPQYDNDREMLVKTFEHSRCLLLRSLEKEQLAS